MLVITSVQLRGHLMGHPVYVIDGISCLSFDASKACQQLDLKVSGVFLCYLLFLTHRCLREDR